MREKTYRGYVVKMLWAPDSKSEHETVCLKLKGGKIVRLRQLGGDPFLDPILITLVGKHIKAVGELVHGNTLITSSWKEVSHKA